MLLRSSLKNKNCLFFPLPYTSILLFSHQQAESISLPLDLGLSLTYLYQYTLLEGMLYVFMFLEGQAASMAPLFQSGHAIRTSRPSCWRERVWRGSTMWNKELFAGELKYPSQMPAPKAPSRLVKELPWTTQSNLSAAEHSHRSDPKMVLHGAEALSSQPTESLEVMKHCVNTPRLGACYTAIDNSSFLKNNCIYFRVKDLASPFGHTLKSCSTSSFISN